MGSVCGSTLSLMDAGVPLGLRGGAAMGLIKEGDEFRILTDIQGIEDFLGDMDFKVAGSEGHHRPADGHEDHRPLGEDGGRSRESSAPGTLHILEKMLKRRYPSGQPVTRTCSASALILS